MPKLVHTTHCSLKSDPIFADNSLAAVMKYKFTPALTQDGKAVPVKVSVEVNYRFEVGNQPYLP